MAKAHEKDKEEKAPVEKTEKAEKPSSKVKMVKVQFVGTTKFKVYNGFDNVAGQNVTVKQGGTVEISQEMADRLEKDFPKQWKPAGKEKE
jgi:hypothetical protein